MRLSDRSIWKTRYLRDEVDDIASEAINAFVEPESNDIVNFFANFWVLPIEIRLFWSEDV
jgi:hypothetical protein